MRLPPVCTAVGHRLAKALQTLPNLRHERVASSSCSAVSICTFSPMHVSTKSPAMGFPVASWLRRISPRVSANLPLLLLHTLHRSVSETGWATAEAIARGIHL